MKGWRMKLKINYEKAEIEVVRIGYSDVITTSGDSMGTGSGNSTEDGWTPVDW